MSVTVIPRCLYRLKRVTQVADEIYLDRAVIVIGLDPKNVDRRDADKDNKPWYIVAPLCNQSHFINGVVADDLE